MADLQQWLYRIQPVRPEMLTEGPTPEEAGITEQHFDYLNDLIGKGILILAGRTQNTGYSSFGIIIFKAENEVAAREIMLSDPAVRLRQFRAELYPYRIALLEPGNV
ncbi:MAG: YciI family protein [Anaerolineae bacterium]|nr:YciI family protein [Anaerolineae bacterium]